MISFNYILDGTRVIAYDGGNDNERFYAEYIYDESGSPVAMRYYFGYVSQTLTDYGYFFFEKNMFGDIVGVYDQNGNKFITFTYDAWGNHTIECASDFHDNYHYIFTQACLFRYRGYQFDTETGFYYLQSRYYDPSTGRFISADCYVNANGGFQGYNMYAYCNNNPVMYVDPDGESILFALFVTVYVIVAVGVLYHLFMPEEVKENMTTDPNNHSIEFEAGHGWGMDIKITEGISAGYSQDKTTSWTLFKKESKVTKNKQSFEIGGAGLIWGFSQRYSKREGTPYQVDREEADSGVTIFGFSINNNNDIVFGSGFSAHMFYGGHVSAEINVSNVVRKVNKKINSIKEFFGGVTMYMIGLIKKLWIFNTTKTMGKINLSIFIFLVVVITILIIQDRVYYTFEINEELSDLVAASEEINDNFGSISDINVKNSYKSSQSDNGIIKKTVFVATEKNCEYELKIRFEKDDQGAWYIHSWEILDESPYGG